jgi:hypothetical protein
VTWFRFELRDPDRAVELPPTREPHQAAWANALSPDGAHQLVGFAYRAIRLRDLAPPHAAVELAPAAAGGIRHLGFGPDQGWIWVLTDKPPAIEIGPARPGAARVRIGLGSMEVTHRGFHAFGLPGRPRVLIGNPDRVVLADGAAGRADELVPPRQNRLLGPLAAAPDGRRIARYDRDDGLLGLELDPARPIVRRVGEPFHPPGPVGTLAFDPAGERILYSQACHLRFMDWPGRP